MKGVLSFFEQMGILNRAFVFGRMSGVPSFGTKTRTVGNNGGQYPATYAGLQAALTASSSGDTVWILANEAVPASLSATITVPDGVKLVGAGPSTSSIVMPAGTPSVATVTFMGNNYCEGLYISSQQGSDATTGGVQLQASNHEFFNCWFDGNQDCWAFTSWGGGTTFRNCRLTGWNFDACRFNSLVSTGQQDLRFFDSKFVGGTAARRFIIGGGNCPMRILIQGCEFDGRAGADANGFSIIGGGSTTDGYCAYKTIISSTGVSASVTLGLSTLTKASEWSSYTWRPGDFFRVSAGGTVGDYPIYQKTDDGTLVAYGDVGAASVDGAVYPGYVYEVRDCTIRASSNCSGSGLFRHSGTSNPSAPTTAGVKILVDNCRIDLPTGASIIKAGTLAHAGVTNQPYLELNNCVLPSGYTLATTTFNVTNRSKVALRGSTLRDAVNTVTDGATITLDPNLGETQVCTSIAGNRTLAVTALSAPFYTGQRFTVILGSDGTGRTVTPDGSTVKGEAISVAATSTLRSTVSYRYTGSYWVQEGMPQETGY